MRDLNGLEITQNETDMLQEFICPHCGEVVGNEFSAASLGCDSCGKLFDSEPLFYVNPEDIE